jgi:hypothetical protein
VIYDMAGLPSEEDGMAAQLLLLAMCGGIRISRWRRLLLVLSKQMREGGT